MKTISHTGGTTYSVMTIVSREVPMLQNFPTVKGKASSVSLKTALMTDTGNTFTYTIYVFKTFGGSSQHWQKLAETMYQTPDSANNHLKVDYIGDVLATKTFSDNLTAGEHQITKALELTEYGKQASNWAGNVYVAIINTSGSTLYWGKSTSSTVALEYLDGVVKYGVGGKFVDCEVHYATGGKWIQAQPHYGINGSYVEVGG